MPYTKQEERDNYNDWLNALIVDLKEQGFPPGDVTYVVYKIVGHWFKDKPKYQTICEVRGMLAGVLSEFDRKFAFPYEDKKIEDNGGINWTLPALEHNINDEIPEDELCHCGSKELGRHARS